MNDRSPIPRCIIFDVGKVLFEWDLRHLFAKLIADPAECEWFVTHVITPEWHFQSDEGRPLAEMLAERKAEYPAHAGLIDAYAARFNETIPGPVADMPALVQRLTAAGVPLFAITNFGHEFWQGFCPTQPLFGAFRDIVVSGTEQLAKPDPAIFRLAIDRFGIDPAGALFVDDRDDNVAAAETCGLKGHVFTDAATLEAALMVQGYLH